MSRTRKWFLVAQEATRLAGLGMSSREIAAAVGVSRSQINRWLAAGKLRRPVRSKRKTGTRRGGALSPAKWAAAVRAEYDLDATDDQLVTLAEMALRMSIDVKVPERVRLAAVGRFQSVVRQLALVARNAEAVPPVEPSTPRPPIRLVTRSTATDPRAQLMGAKPDPEPA